MSSQAVYRHISIGASDEKPLESENKFKGPQAELGATVPFIFGTVEQRSPICIYAGPVDERVPFDAVYSTDHKQFISTLDLILCERVLTDGVQVGTIQLRKIWYNGNLLWDGTGPAFTTPVTTSNNLLRHDPNGDDEFAVPGGGYVDDAGIDRLGTDGWWGGGISGELDPIITSLAPILIGGAPDIVYHGRVIGWWTKSESGVWAQYLGLEKVWFYVGSGDEDQNTAIATEEYGPLAQTNFQYVYPEYNKFSRLVFFQFCWGEEPEIHDISAEVTVTCPAVEIGDTTGIMPNGLDVNPVSLLYTLLTHPDFCGGPKLPGIDVDSFSAARAILYEEEMGASYILREPTKAGELVRELLAHINGMMFVDPTTGLICLSLTRPQTAEIPTFDETSVISLDELSKTTWEATYSQCRVTFEMRGGSGNEQGASNVAVAKDPGLALNSGLVETIDRNMPTIYEADVANETAARILGEANTPQIRAVLKMTRTKSDGGTGVSPMDLRPGDLFRLNYEPLQITNLRLKVLKVEPGTLADNAVTVTTVQDIYQAQAIFAPPEQPDDYTVVPPPGEVTIETYRMFTAPYYFARTGLGPDARRVLTTAPIYQVDEDTAGKEFAVNYDRFMMLAKAPYAGAATFQWTLDDSGGTTVHSATVPYTECGTLAAVVATAGHNDSGALSSLEIEGLTSTGVALLTSGPDKMLLIGDELFLVSPANATAGEDGESVTIAPCERQMLDSPQNDSFHDVGDTAWILESWSSNWLSARLAPPLQSSVEEYWDFDTEAPTDGYLNDYQDLLPAYTLRIRNLDSSKTNFETEDTAVLQDRANRALPIRQVDFASSTATASAAATSFTYDFEQLTSTARLHQQREIGSLTGVDNSFALLLPKLQDSADKWSAESVAGILTETQEDDFHHVLKLDVWYEYITGPLAGTILRRTDDNPTPAGDGSVTFTATAEATTRQIRCYLRACFAPYVLGDAGYVPIRRSVVRTMLITLDRT